MGEMKGINLAEKLRMKSDEKHVSIAQRMFEEFYLEIIREAEKCADVGLYEATIYGANLENDEVVSRLIKTLKLNGFKAYSGTTRGLGKINPGQPFLTISWK